VSANPPNDPESSDEPEVITDLSELSFDFEETTPSSRRPVYGSAVEESDPGELSEELELLDSLAGQITGDGPPEFYCKPLGQLLGPMSLVELRIMAESGALAGDDLVRYGENGEWKPAGTFVRLAESLHRGLSITSEPISSAPPSTRRLFQTGYKPTGDSFGEDSAGSQWPAPVESSAPTKDTASSGASGSAPSAPEAAGGNATPQGETGTLRADSAASVVNKTEDASGVVNEPEAKPAAKTPTGGDPRRKKASKKSPDRKKAGKKSAAKKKAAKKRNDEDDAILNDIFSEVFADDQKTQRPAMPPATTSSSGLPAAQTEPPAAPADTPVAVSPEPVASTK
jgi:hypothetical protein